MDFKEDDFWFAFRIQFSLVRQWIHTWRQFTRPFWLPRCMNCGAPAVAVHRRSSTSSSFRRGRSPWSRLFSRPQRFLRCRSFSGGRCPGCAGRAVPQVVHLRIQRTAWFDRGYKICVSFFTEIFTFFYVKRWITDPEVDSRLSGVSASHLFLRST